MKFHPINIWPFIYQFRSCRKGRRLTGISIYRIIRDGTDAKGHEAGIDFQVAKQVKTGISYFVNEKNIDKSKDYKRLQIDVSVKF